MTANGVRGPSVLGIRAIVLCLLVMVFASCSAQPGTQDPGPAPPADDVVSTPVQLGPSDAWSAIPDDTRSLWTTSPVAQGVWGLVLGVPACSKAVTPCGIP